MTTNTQPCSEKYIATTGSPAATFFNCVFNGHVDQDNLIQVWTLQDKQSKGFTDTTSAAEYAVQQCSTHAYDVYFGVGLYQADIPSNKRGGKLAVQSVCMLWADIDCQSEAHADTNLPATKQQANQLFDYLPWPPSLVWDSGNGLQAAWLLKEQFDAGPELDRFCKRWAETLHQVADAKCGWLYDKSTSDYSRVLRIPGTINQKDRNKPLAVNLLVCEPGRTYDVQDIEPELVALPRTTTTHTTSGNADTSELLQTLQTNTTFKLAWQNEHLPPAFKDTSQSGYDFAMALAVVEHEGTPEQLQELIRQRRTKVDAEPEKADRPDYVQSTYNAAASKFYATAGTVCQNASDITIEPIEWLWPNHIPLGSASVLSGDAGLGKSMVTVDLAARLSQAHNWPDETPAILPPSETIILSSEDDADTTIVPRFLAAGGHHKSLWVLHGVKSKETDSVRLLALSEDLRRLDLELRRHSKVRLVIIDPVSAYYGQGINERSNEDIRRVLGPVKLLAKKRQVSFLLLTHRNKNNTQDPRQRTMGSVGLVAQSRSAWMVAKDKDDPLKRQLLPLKFNLGPDPVGLMYQIEGFKLPNADSSTVDTARVRWLGPSDDTIETQLGADTVASKYAEACEWIKANVKEHDTRPVKKIQQLAEKSGIKRRTFYRAKGDVWPVVPVP